MKEILLVGAGPMAIEYTKVLKALKIPFLTIGRSIEGAKKYEEATGNKALIGGLTQYLQENKDSHENAIVTVNENLLGLTTIELIRAGYKEILVEKPGGADIEEIKQVSLEEEKHDSKVFVAYNRRFYSSVQEAQRIIAEDGGLASFNFEFTEWSHVIAGLEKAPGVKENWFLHNSTHIIDLAFFVGGKPREISAFKAGGLSWHPSASVFAGAGISDNGALFSYQANWEAPGRWGLEFLTKKHRLILRPLEKLQVQNIGSVAIEELQIDDKLDKDFKPGLYEMVRNFITDNGSKLPSLHEQVENSTFYRRINSK